MSLELVAKAVEELTTVVTQGFAQVNGKLDSLLDLAAPQRSRAFDGICVLPANQPGVVAPRETTWTCLKLNVDDEPDCEFDYCLISSAHVGLSHFCTTLDVAFVALPDFLRRSAEKVAIYVPSGLSSPTGYVNAANDVIIVKFKLLATFDKTVLPSNCNWPPSRAYCPTPKDPHTDWSTQGVVGKSSMELVSGSAATKFDTSGACYFLLDKGEPGDSGTLLFSVCPPKHGPADAMAGAGEPATRCLYEPIGVFQGVSSKYQNQRKRGKIAPLPCLKDAAQLQSLDSSARPQKVLLVRGGGFQWYSIAPIAPGVENGFVDLKSLDTKQVRFGMLVSVDTENWGWKGPMRGLSPVGGEDGQEESDGSEAWGTAEGEEEQIAAKDQEFGLVASETMPSLAWQSANIMSTKHDSPGGRKPAQKRRLLSHGVDYETTKKRTKSGTSA